MSTLSEYYVASQLCILFTNWL